MKTAPSMGGAAFGASVASVQHFLRPHNLDLLAVLPKTVDARWRRKTCQGKLAYIVHVLCELRAKFRAEPEDFTPLSYALLVPIVGTRYTASALEVLQESGVIESDRRFILGIKSRGYRFAPTYRTTVETFPPVERSARKSSVQQIERVRRAVGDNPNYVFIFDSLKSLSFAPGVEEFLSSSRVTDAARASLRLSYENLKRGRFEFSTDSKTGRVFHNVANMAKPLRQFLLLDGESCQEVDLANAQPLLLLSLYRGIAAATERRRYADFVSGGRFYERLNEIAGSPYDANAPEDRDRLKRAFQQQILSGKNHYTGRLKDAFSAKFPALSRAISKEKQGDHTALSLRLQRVEADLVINKVVTRLRTAHVGTKVITIHDAVLCAASQAETVASVLSEETRALLTVLPTLHRSSTTHHHHA